MKKVRALLQASVLASLILTACAGPAAPTAAPSEGTTAPATEPTTAPATGGDAEPSELRIAWGQDPDTLNPAYSFLAVSYTIFDLMYSALVKEGPNGEYYGDLADTWEVSDDGLTWTYTLRPNIVFHDGTPLVAEDVAWMINTIKDDPEGWAALNSYTAGFVEATAPDVGTVVITTDYPISNMNYRVSVLYAVKRADFEGFTTAEELQNFTNAEGVGTGAYKLVTYDTDQGVVIMEANADFYAGAPAIDRLIFQTFDSGDAQVQAFRAGDVDLLYDVPSTAVETVRGIAGTTVVQRPTRGFTELIVNATLPDNDPAPTGNPALADLAVRQAMSHAINKQDIVDIVWQGLARPEWSIIAPAFSGGFYHNDAITDHAFSLDSAREVLDAAGWVPGSDGVREKDGMRLEFRLEFDADSDSYPRIADLIATNFREVGMEATPAAVDSDTLIARTTGVGDFDLVIWGWGGSDPDPDFMLSIMTCGQFVSGGWSDSGYCNEEYDMLYAEQQAALDPAERQRIIHEMQALLFRDLPYIVLTNEDSVQAYRSDLFTGFPDYTADSTYGLGLTDAYVLRQAQPVP
jgi:peptide/nickel transport system substrate-binding protein